MSVEILLLGVLVGITILGYMLAINSHGPTRLSISYLMATILLAGTVLAIVQFVNDGLEAVNQQVFQRLEMEKNQAEENAMEKEHSLQRSKKMMDAAIKFNIIISEANSYSASIMNVNVRDFSVELDILMNRAVGMQRQVKDISNKFSQMNVEKGFFPDVYPLVEQALEHLTDAARYYRQYFRAEDTPQEELRERMMRQRARSAQELLSKAASAISASK